MWQARIESLNDGRTHHYAFSAGDRAVTYADILGLWKVSNAFRSYFSQLLAESPLPAFRWETPPITTATIDRNFEFVLLRGDSLERPLDSEAFAEHFGGSGDVATFANLGGDAVMIAPCPIAKQTRYGHLASFLRTAPDEQVHHLWQAVAQAMELRVGDRPVWLSTAGMGVSWLHVRLDDRPKYYGHAPFKQL